MLGIILVLVGGAFLAAQYLNVDLGEIGWPVWIIGPGLILLLAGFLVPGGSGMIIGGTVVTAIGLLLFYQDATNHWESWAYAWALIGPGASGLGICSRGYATAIRRRCAPASRRRSWASGCSRSATCSSRAS